MWNASSLSTRIARRAFPDSQFGQLVSRLFQVVGLETLSRYSSQFSKYVPNSVAVSSECGNGVSRVMLMHSSEGNDAVVRTIWNWGIDAFEPPLPKVFRALCAKSSTVAIVGANTGYYILQAMATSNVVEVVAFEPYERARSLLHGNLKLNGISERVTVCESAVGEVSGKADLFIPTARFGEVVETSASLNESFNTCIGNVVTIDVVTLDNYFAKPSVKLSVVLIDAEGFELQVLKGGESIINEHMPFVIVEVLSERGGRIEELQDFINGIPYEPWSMSELGCIRRESVCECTSSPNQIWVPISRREEFTEIIKNL